jgi:hypothetical protein
MVRLIPVVVGFAIRPWLRNPFAHESTTSVPQILLAIVLMGWYFRSSYVIDVAWRDALATTVDCPTNYEAYLSIMAIFYNEAHYLAEWIEYHLVVGVEHFWLGDNNSTDNAAAVLAPYVAAGIVNYTVVTGAHKQRVFYNDCLPVVRKTTFWIAVIDIDEFLVPVIGHSVPDILRRLEFAGGIDVNIAIFGSNGKKVREPGLVIERFRNHTPIGTTRFTKAIINPRVTAYMDTHEAGYRRGLRSQNPSGVYHPNAFQTQTREPDCRMLRINHYWSKSVEEWLRKQSRGCISGNPSYPINAVNTLRDVVANDTLVDWSIPLIKDQLAKRSRI